MYIEVEQIDYHCNGVCGEPFHVVKFQAHGERLLATVFDGGEEQTKPFNPRVAVFNRDKLANGDIAFGSNSYSGDVYADTLYLAIKYKDAPYRYPYGYRVLEHYRT